MSKGALVNVMPKVLFLTGELKHYRIPILNLISDEIDLTVAHAGQSMKAHGLECEEILLTERRLRAFTIHRKGLVDLCNTFDVVVSMLYLQKLSLMWLGFSPRRRFKLIYWGIGVRASQKSTFDSPGISNMARAAMIRISDASIFYSEYARRKHIQAGIEGQKLFVMPNTVWVDDALCDWSMPRNRILFVGTLNRSKKIFSLLHAYKSVCETRDRMPGLDIVGGGADYDGVIEWVSDNKLETGIRVLGPIFDERALARVFSSALACISPGQAGLTVLKSFGYGVPFITEENAITGGERLNIVDGVNGILYEGDEQLESTVRDIAIDPMKYIEMGKRAREYYLQHRTPEMMAEGFVSAVRFVAQTWSS